MRNPWEIFLESCKGPREAPAPEVPPTPEVRKDVPGKGRKKAAPKAPAKQ